jgi:hypothetical protein
LSRRRGPGCATPRGKTDAFALRANTTLTSLDLRDNDIGDAGAAALGEALRVNKTLTLLELYGTAISDEAGFRKTGLLLALVLWHTDERARRESDAELGGDGVGRGDGAPELVRKRQQDRRRRWRQR